MRLIKWIVLGLVLAGCAQTGPRHLAGQLAYGGIAYDVRPLPRVAANAYEAVVAWRPGVHVDSVVAKHTLFQKAAERLKNDGYDRMVIGQPSQGALVETKTYGGREITRTEYPGIEYRVTGYKPGDAVPSEAMAVSDYIGTSRSGSGGTSPSPSGSAPAPAFHPSSVRRNNTQPGS
jgi:hypothetical protein